MIDVAASGESKHEEARLRDSMMTNLPFGTQQFGRVAPGGGTVRWRRPTIKAYNPRAAKALDWPLFTGEDWAVLVNDHARLLRYLGDWEEYEHRGVGCRFWRDTVVVERAAAARRLQLMFRQFWFVQGPIHWYSVAFTWKMPPAVKKFEEVLG